ncbi:MAG TPA: hypothetical protein VFG18_04940 [Xanthomonadaceae bacterium]|nr:hypothetical protein [Xanthomonadaceae bacterium]
MRPVRSRAFAWLALVAMLLLAAVPSLGRLAGAQSPSAPGTVPWSHAMHATQAIAPAGHGMHHAAAVQPGHRSDALQSPGKAPSENGHAGHDCAYCPLLSGLNLTASVPWLPRARLPHAPWAVRAAANPPLAAPVPALGGQGPPVSAIA